MLNKYQIIRLAWGPLLFKTRSFGKVEMRSAKRDTPQERSCLEQSARTFGMSIKAAEANVVENPSVEYCSRIVAIVEAPSAIEALRTATAQFEETLDILETFGSIGRHTLERVGLIHDFSKATREPIRPKAQRASSLAATFDGHTDNLQMMNIEQIILSYDANGRNSYELADRLLRSSYWSRKARSEVNPQLRVLFRWFAIESIWLAKSDDGTANQEDAISPTMWALGFPSKGGSTMQTIREKVEELSSEVPEYAQWRSRLRSDLHKLRIFRHRSVHNGFRLLDVGRCDISYENLKYYDSLSYRACAYVQKFAVFGIAESITTAKELVELSPLIFEKHVSVNSVNHLIRSLRTTQEFVRYVQPDWDIND